ncbi:protein of unknown function [Nitrospina watsonii]|uniref:Uncharacterized protein n=1 Tax=Nitrospina watsonii TaxID=1323948 RepID=A0ABM9HG39_9BACT|nr:protein of unknown function [Nitrospina watsonii]
MVRGGETESPAYKNPSSPPLQGVEASPALRAYDHLPLNPRAIRFLRAWPGSSDENPVRKNPPRPPYKGGSSAPSPQPVTQGVPLGKGRVYGKTRANPNSPAARATPGGNGHTKVPLPYRRGYIEDNHPSVPSLERRGRLKAGINVSPSGIGSPPPAPAINALPKPPPTWWGAQM